MCPMRSSFSRNLASGANRIVRSPNSPAVSTSAVSTVSPLASGNTSVSPTGTLRPGRTSADQFPGESCCVNST